MLSVAGTKHPPPAGRDFRNGSITEVLYLVGVNGKILRCQGPSVAESDLPVAEGLENVVEDAALDMAVAGE